MRARGILVGVVATALAGGVVVANPAAGEDSSAATGGSAAQPASEAAPGVLATATQRAAEGRPTGIISKRSQRSLRSRGAASISPAVRSSARVAFQSSKVKQGLRPTTKMRKEPYVEQNACYALELPGVKAFRDMLLETFPRSRSSLGAYNITRGCNTPGVSEHEEGRALDFEANIDNPLQYAQAKRLLRYLTRNKGYHARRWGIMYIIFNKQIWAQYKPWWRNMSDRGNKTDNHQDHIHFSFTWNGAVQRSSYWTGQVRRANRGPCVRYKWHFAPVYLEWQQQHSRTWNCRAPKPFDSNWQYGNSIMYWQSDSRVRWLQQFLTEEGVYSAETEGNFGPITFQAVRTWQAQHKLPQTGVWDPVTQNASGRVVEKREATNVTGGWLGETPATLGQAFNVPIVVTTDGVHPRVIEVQRKQLGVAGSYETVLTGTTDAAGNFVVAMTAEPGTWKYRVKVADSSRYRAKKSGIQTLVVP